MNEEPSARVAEPSDIDYRLLIPFLTHVTITQTLILIIRITTSYRAIELGLPVLWLGIIATGFAIIPAFTALRSDAGSTAATTPRRSGSAPRSCSWPASGSGPGRNRPCISSPTVCSWA
jgi:hypothetical protein